MYAGRRAADYLLADLVKNFGHRRGRIGAHRNDKEIIAVVILGVDQRLGIGSPRVIVRPRLVAGYGRRAGGQLGNKISARGVSKMDRVNFGHKSLAVPLSVLAVSAARNAASLFDTPLPPPIVGFARRKARSKISGAP